MVRCIVWKCKKIGSHIHNCSMISKVTAFFGVPIICWCPATTEFSNPVTQCCILWSIFHVWLHQPCISFEGALTRRAPVTYCTNYHTEEDCRLSIMCGWDVCGCVVCYRNATARYWPKSPSYVFRYRLSNQTFMSSVGRVAHTKRCKHSSDCVS